jgi:peptidyl-prolyl cis-trans isomerase SurA
MKVNKFLLIIISFFFSSLTGEGKIVDRIIAVVNEEAITQSELQEALTLIKLQLGKRLSEYSEKELQKEVLSQLITEKLIIARAKEAEINVPPEEVEERLEEIRKQLGGEEELARALKSQGLNIEFLRRTLENKIRAERLIRQEVLSQVKIEPGEIEKYYYSHLSEFTQPARVKLRQLVVLFKGDKNSALKKVEIVREKLKKGEDFIELIKKYSDVLQEKKGALGYVKLEDLAPGIREKIKGLKIGEVAEIEKERGVWFLKVEAREKARIKSLKEVTPDIQTQLKMMKIEEVRQTWLEKLKQEAVIEIKIEK